MLLKCFTTAVEVEQCLAVVSLRGGDLGDVEFFTGNRNFLAIKGGKSGTGRIMESYRLAKLALSSQDNRLVAFHEPHSVQYLHLATYTYQWRGR